MFWNKKKEVELQKEPKPMWNGTWHPDDIANNMESFVLPGKLELHHIPQKEYENAIFTITHIYFWEQTTNGKPSFFYRFEGLVLDKNNTGFEFVYEPPCVPPFSQRVANEYVAKGELTDELIDYFTKESDEYGYKLSKIEYEPFTPFTNAPNANIYLDKK